MTTDRPVKLVMALGLALALSTASCKRAPQASRTPLRELSPVYVTRQSSAEPDSQPAPIPAGHARARSVLLLTVDALRADQPWVGYRGVETPVLSRFADESVIYTHAYTVANTTTPSLAAILSSRYPSELSRDNCPLAGFRYDASLPKVLLGAGVHTFAAHGHAIFASAFAPSDGFTDWKLVENAAGRRASDGAVTGDEVASLVVTFLQTPAASTPFFAWAHFVDPHDRYVAHPDFPAASTGGERALYDGEVAYTDHAIGRVLQALDAAGLRETTAVIVTADHGEAFGEHNRYRHGFTVFDEEVHVPLLARIPGVSPRREPVRRSSIDLAPTIAELLSVEAPASWRGTSLLADLGQEAPVPRTVIIDTPDLRTLPAQRAVLDGDRKVIPHADRTSTVFDIVADPEERTPLPTTDAADSVDRALAALAALTTVPPDPCQRE